MKKIITLLLMVPLLYGYESYSEYKQDQYLYETFFKDQKEGFFVELGAYDGKQCSNSLFFEKHFNWNGICIEAMPDMFEKLVQNRNCICVNECISSDNEPKTFFRIRVDEKKKENDVHAIRTEMLSGIKENYVPQHTSKITRFLNKYQGEVETFTVYPKTLQQVFNETGTLYVDFLSLDIEGGELDVLESIDYEKVEIKVILVENNYNDPKISEFLSKKGYTFVKKMLNDEFYVLKQEQSL